MFILHWFYLSSSLVYVTTYANIDGCDHYHSRKSGSVWKMENTDRKWRPRHIILGGATSYPCRFVTLYHYMTPNQHGTFTTVTLSGAYGLHLYGNKYNKYWKVIISTRDNNSIFNSKIVVTSKVYRSNRNKSLSIYKLPAFIIYPRYTSNVNIQFDVKLQLIMEYVPVTETLAMPMKFYDLRKDAGKMFVSFENYYINVGSRRLMGRIISGTWKEADALCTQSGYRLFSVSGTADLTLLKKLYSDALMKFTNIQYLGLKVRSALINILNKQNFNIIYRLNIMK